MLKFIHTEFSSADDMVEIMFRSGVRVTALTLKRCSLLQLELEVEFFKWDEA